MGKGSRLQFRARATDDLTGFYDVVSLVPGVPDAAPLWLRLTRNGGPADGLHLRRRPDLEARRGSHLDPARPGAGRAGRHQPRQRRRQPGHVRGPAHHRPERSGFAHVELGTLGGYAAGAPARLELANAGRGLANAEDGATLVHRIQQHEGDVELTARVTALRKARMPAARIGLALRGNLAAGARMVAFVLELSNTGQRSGCSGGAG